MRRRVVASEAFLESVARLEDSPENVSMREALVLRVETQPESAPAIGDTNVHVVRTTSNGGAPLRLFYEIHADAVELLFIERYDELLPWGEE